MERPYLFPTALAISLAALLPTGGARADSSPQQPAQPSPPQSALTFGDMAKRMVRYADSIKSASDIDPMRFSNAINTPLLPVAVGADILNSGSRQLATGQVFAAFYSPSRGEDALPLHSVNFARTMGASYTDDHNGECLWDAEEAGKALEAIGFHRGPNVTFQRGRMQRYWRGLSEDDMIFDASILTYTTKPGSGGKACVYAFRYYGGTK